MSNELACWVSLSLTMTSFFRSNEPTPLFKSTSREQVRDESKPLMGSQSVKRFTSETESSLASLSQFGFSRFNFARIDIAHVRDALSNVFSNALIKLFLDQASLFWFTHVSKLLRPSHQNTVEQIRSMLHVTCSLVLAFCLTETRLHTPGYLYEAIERLVGGGRLPCWVFWLFRPLNRHSLTCSRVVWTFERLVYFEDLRGSDFPDEFLESCAFLGLTDAPSQTASEI